MKKIFLIIFLGGLLLPSVSLAVSYNTYKADGKTVIYEGLVPCGKEVCIYSGEAVESFLEYLKFLKVKFPEFTFGEICEKVGVELSEWKSIPCQFCHFFVMFKGILDFALKLVIIIGVLMLTIGGFMFFFAGGSPASLDRAKGILTSTAIGLVIIFAAWLIVNSILTFPGFINPQLSWDPTKWFQVECPIEKIITKEREKKEDYQKKITNLEKEIAELEEERTAAARDQNIEKVKGLTYEIAQIQRILQNYKTESADFEEKEEEEPEEEEEKIYRCGECGKGLHICNEKQCLRLGDSEKPCQYTPAWKWAWYGYCEPK